MYLDLVALKKSALYTAIIFFILFLADHSEIVAGCVKSTVFCATTVVEWYIEYLMLRTAYRFMMRGLGFRK